MSLFILITILVALLAACSLRYSRNEDQRGLILRHLQYFAFAFRYEGRRRE